MEILYGYWVFACLLQMYRWMGGWVDGGYVAAPSGASKGGHQKQEEWDAAVAVGEGQQAADSDYKDL